MPASYVSPHSQSWFCAALRYFQRGSFSTFFESSELAFGLEAVQERFFCPNMLSAAQIAGICDVTTVTGTIQWWVSHQGDVLIDSAVPKEIGTCSDWFSTNGDCVVPLITDFAMSPLILGARRSGNTVASGVFATPFIDLVSPFREVEEQLCAKVAYSDELAGTVEVFSNARARWEKATLPALTGPQLFRLRGDYSGLSYYVQYSDIRVRFKVLQPDWAFVVAHQLLPWRLADILQVQGASVRIPRAARLPILMYRSLFAGAETARIGPVLAFENVRPEILAGIIDYFKTAGERP